MRDDQKFLELMALYKRLRLSPEGLKSSEKVLKIAIDIKKMGEVSEEAKEAAKYL